MNQPLPYRIFLRDKWTDYLSWVDLNNWIESNIVRDEDWHYYTYCIWDGELDAKFPSIGFKDEGDAVAFKLRFGDAALTI